MLVCIFAFVLTLDIKCAEKTKIEGRSDKNADVAIRHGG
jgi:hypothetical protein